MNEDKLNALQCEVQQHAQQLQQCKSDCLANAAEIDALKSQLIAIREMIEDRDVH